MHLENNFVKYADIDSSAVHVDHQLHSRVLQNLYTTILTSLYDKSTLSDNNI